MVPVALCKCSLSGGFKWINYYEAEGQKNPLQTPSFQCGASTHLFGQSKPTHTPKWNSGGKSMTNMLVACLAMTGWLTQTPSLLMALTVSLLGFPACKTHCCYDTISKYDHIFHILCAQLRPPKSLYISYIQWHTQVWKPLVKMSVVVNSYE